jgi:hypothetical protein
MNQLGLNHRNQISKELALTPTEYLGNKTLRTTDVANKAFNEKDLPAFMQNASAHISHI